ncbi:MAG: F0F1 ATP synthase subunit B [bacterium]|nr:F0F1 ATP synthase subunit B [bacterium]
MELFQAFGIQPLVLLAQAVNAGILFFILQRLLYKPIGRILDERRLRIAESLRRAEEIDTRFKMMREEEARILTQAREEASRIVHATQEDMTALRKETLMQARNQTEKMLMDARAQIDQERVHLLSVVKEDSMKLVTQLTSLILAKYLTRKDQDRVLSGAVKELKAEA